MKKQIKYDLKISGLEGDHHENSIRSKSYEAYIYGDTINIANNGILLCRVVEGKLDLGGIKVFSIRGPSNEFFACLWTYEPGSRKINDFMAAVSVEIKEDEKITREHKMILQELVKEAKEGIYD